MFRSSLYVSSPRWLQELMISGRSRVRLLLRESRSYRTFLARARDRETWSSAQLREYSEQKLRQLLIHSDQFVPYYSRLFERMGFSPSRNGLPGAIAELPYLTKGDILNNGEDLLARKSRSIRVRGSTSGTTGTPIGIVQDLSAISREHAFLARQLAWAGYEKGQPRVWLRGDIIVPTDDTSGPFWRMNRAENMLMMSSYHLSERTAMTYLRALTDFAPAMIEAYPSAIVYFAKFLESENRYFESSKLHSIVTSSETLTEENRRLVETRFRCQLFDWYGAFERVAAIGTCRKGRYHLMTDYSFTEFEPAGDGLFEIIGTGFNNFLMPLIRYRTGDLVKLPAEGTECECGMSFPVIERILGRMEDTLKLSDGRRIGSIDIFKGVTGVAEAQVVQDELDVIRVLVVPYNELADRMRQKIVDNAQYQLGSGTEIRVEVVQNIPKSSNGKFRNVVCNI